MTANRASASGCSHRVMAAGFVARELPMRRRRGISLRPSRLIRVDSRADGSTTLHNNPRPFLSAAARKPVDRADRARTGRGAVCQLERADSERMLQRQRSRPYHGRARRPYPQQLRDRLTSIFGPTLCGWLERHGKIAYRAIRLGDEAQRRASWRSWQRDGASVQPFDPAAAERAGREIQIAWGSRISSIASAAGRKGIWLPECAVDDATLAAVAQRGNQVHDSGAGQGRLIRRRRQRQRPGRSLWQRDLRKSRYSASTANFPVRSPSATALNDGTRWPTGSLAYAARLPPGAALMIATDGETFGHHKKTGAAELGARVGDPVRNATASS